MTSDMDRITKLVDNPLLKEGRQIVSIDTSKVDRVDILPAHVDLALRDHFEEISLDDQAVLQRMREEGLSEEQIADLKVRVSSEVIGMGDALYKGLHTMRDGRSEIALYPNAILRYYHGALSQLASTNPGEDFTKVMEPSYYLSDVASQSFYHEIRHEKQHRVDGDFTDANEGYLQRVRARYDLGFVASSLCAIGGAGAVAEYVSYGHTEPRSLMFAGFLALSGIVASLAGKKALKSSRAYKDYEANPIEIDARRAGAEAPNDAIQLTPNAEVTASFRRG